MKNIIKHILFSFFFSSICVINAQNKKATSELPEKKSKDSVQISKEINLIEQDSIENDSIKKKKGFLDGDVTYSATDYMRLNRRNNKMYLYNNAKITYTDLDIESGSIIVHQAKKEVYAKGLTDSTETYVQTPIFTQGPNIVEPDTIRFNFDSKKALIYNSKTSQGEFNIINEVSKRENDSVVYMKNVKFTTSKDLEDPEYYFYARKIKFIPKKKIVSGLVNMYIVDIPTPLGLPFGYFPMKEEAVSGFIVPSFNDSNLRGFTFQNGGYYFAISDYMDLTVVGDYSTNSSFAIRTDSNYAKRYKYRGSLSFRFENNLNSERGLPDFSKSSNYNLRWSHSQDSKAAPNSRFSSSVNFGSSQFFRQSVNQSNFGSQLNNTLSSNISYSRSFPTQPKIDFTTAVNIQQNSRTQLIDFNTPTQLNISRIYPFTPKSGTKKGIIQNINFQITSSLINRVQVAEDDFFTAETFKKSRLGVRHRIPISTNFKILKHFSSSLGTSLTENWVFETIRRRFDPDERANNGIVTDTVKGFDAFRTFSGISTSLGTTVYGTVKFKKDAKIKALRHVVRPQVSYSYGPAYDNLYEDVLIPGDPELGIAERVESFSRFQEGVFSPPGRTVSSSMNFSISNNIEAKVTDRDTTKLEPKKIKILNALNFSSGYNFKADSLKLRPISVSGNIPLTKKLSINFGGTLDPYALNSNNRRINKLNIDNGGSLFRLTNARMNFGYSFSSKDFENRKKKKDDEDNLTDEENETLRNGGRPDDLFGTHTNFRNGKLFDDDSEEEKTEKTDVDFYNYRLPWNFRLSYTLNYTNSARQDQISAHSLNFSGDVELAPRWKVGASSGYDVLNKGITFTNLRFQRDLESFSMSFNWVPFSSVTSWSFFIGISSSLLSDLKWDKRSEPDRRL